VTLFRQTILTDGIPTLDSTQVRARCSRRSISRSPTLITQTPASQDTYFIVGFYLALVKKSHINAFTLLGPIFRQKNHLVGNAVMCTMVTAVHFKTGIMCAPSITLKRKLQKVILFSSTLTHSQCDAGNITFCNFCCFRCASP